TSWTNNIMINGVSYNYAYKYKLVNTSTTDEYSMVLRLAEQYLIRAEAEANGEGNGINGAIADLNIIRNRAGLGNTTANDKNSLLSAISHERQVELFTEWGDRWLNLKRTGQIDAVMGIVTPLKGGTWNTNYQLYPIPEQQILNDPNMTDSQNPGY
ncbi:MAG TPA: RagB/SusD family nutrient uptake outer membrane protein, partial [Mucilaginibacter sp.]